MPENVNLRVVAALPAFTSNLDPLLIADPQSTTGIYLSESSVTQNSIRMRCCETWSRDAVPCQHDSIVSLRKLLEVENARKINFHVKGTTKVSHNHTACKEEKELKVEEQRECKENCM